MRDYSHTQKVTKSVGMSKVTARLVPRLLTTDDMEICVLSSNAQLSKPLLTRRREDSLDRVTIPYDTLVNCVYTPPKTREYVVKKGHLHTFQIDFLGFDRLSYVYGDEEETYSDTLILHHRSSDHMRRTS